MRESEAQDWMGWGTIGVEFEFINIMVAIEVIGLDELIQIQYVESIKEEQGKHQRQNLEKQERMRKSCVKEREPEKLYGTRKENFKAEIFDSVKCCFYFHC